MSARLISAYAIYNAGTGTYYGDNPIQIAINCNLISPFSPRLGYLKRRILMGVAGGSIMEYLPTFDANDPEIDSNTLTGVFVEIEEGLVMINAVSVANVILACDNCCDTANGYIVSPLYASGIPSFTSPSVNTYTVTRSDNGTPGAVDQFSMDYMEYSVQDPTHTSYTSGTSVYKLYAFGTPTAVGTDVIT